jgi:hypothetical protein
MNNEKNPIMTDIEEQKALIAQAQADLDKKLQAIEKQKENARNIERHEKFLEQDIKIGKAQVAATKKYADDLEAATKQFGKFKIVLTESESNRSVYDYDHKAGTKEMVCEIKGMVPKAHIVYKQDASYQITVSEHYVTNGWHASSKGYKMSIIGMGWEAERKMYTNAKTVIKKIEDHYYAKLQEVARKKAIEDLRNNTDWSQMYPNATVTQETMYEGGWNRGRYDKYANSFFGTRIVLANGITVSMKPWADGSWSVWNVKFPTPEVPKGNANEVLEALNNMAF